MIVVVTGGRYFDNETMVENALNIVYPSMVIHGGCRAKLEKNGEIVLTGADYLADKWAKRTATPHMVFPARWDTEGRAAGPIRNREMLMFAKSMMEMPSLTDKKLKVIAFPGGRGTLNCIKTAKELGIEVMDLGKNYYE